MLTTPSVLCPIDFSEASRGALRYAAAIAEHFYVDLTVLTVDDPFMVDATAAAMDEHWLEQQTQAALETFVHDTFASRRPELPAIRTRIATGRPAAEILRVADDTHADVIVMGTHGTSGVRKMMFGSVTERVLRETHLPVVVTPATDPGPESLEAWKKTLTTVLVPVDLSAWTTQQVAVGRGLAEALGTDIVLLHVLDDADEEHRLHAHQTLDAMIHTLPAALRPAMTLGTGDAAPEIARVARQRNAGVIVMGLHASPGIRHRVGAVTYALLCQTPALVLAWPPARMAGTTLASRKASEVVVI